MAFEEDFRQKYIEEREHLQKIEENKQIQRKLDIIIKQLDQESQLSSSDEREPSYNELVTEGRHFQSS